MRPKFFFLERLDNIVDNYEDVKVGDLVVRASNPTRKGLYKVAKVYDKTVDLVEECEIQGKLETFSVGREKKGRCSFLERGDS